MEEVVTREKPFTAIPLKKTLLLSMLLSVLVFSLFHYVLPSILHPLRIDTIPADAYIIPWMQPNPSFETLQDRWWSKEPWDIDDTMTNALKLYITFNITTRNGTRTIPSTIYLGHDKDYLYIGGKFVGIGTNPTSPSEGDEQTNFFNIYFDTKNDGILTPPESGSRFTISFFPSNTSQWGFSAVAYGAEDMVWANHPEYSNPDRQRWLSAEYVYFEYVYFEYVYFYSGHMPPPAIKSFATKYDNSTKTLYSLFSRYLNWSPNTGCNKLQMRAGECWVMGFILELGYSPTTGTDVLIDGWPRNTYPYLDNDSSWWPKLVIDLTNPPDSLST